MQQKWNQNFDGEPMTDIPQKFLNAGCDVYMVMQLRHDEKILDERFASMRELNRRGKTPDPEHYEVTYYADLSAMWQDVPNNEVLEELFQMFNLSRPQDFEGHSLSVSDVIALKRNGEVSVHYVDSIGFKDLQGFLDKQPERPSVLMNLKEKCDAPECNPTGCRKVRLNMNFNHEELMLMMLYNTGTRLGLIHELRLMQCYLMPDETALRELSEGVIEKLKLLTDAEFAELEFPPD